MPLWWSHLFIYFLLVSRESSAWGSMAQRQNSFEVSVKRLFLIRFICSATSKTICPRRNPKTLHSTPPSHLRDLVVVEQRCKSPQTVKKKPSGQGGGGCCGCSKLGVFGGLGRRSRAGQSKWWTAVRSVLWAPTYMQSRPTCELSQLPLVFR